MLLSDFVKNGTTMQGKAGPAAINANDLLTINSLGQLAPVSVSDYAAFNAASQAPVSSTAVAASSPIYSSRKFVAINPADSSILIATTNQINNQILAVYKYSASGAVLGSVNIESSFKSIYSPCIARLSNGNYAVSWKSGAENLGPACFAIIDANLNILVAATVIETTASGLYLDMIPLSGGGFAVAYFKAQPYLAIYNNSGGVVYTGAAIASSPAPGSGGASRIVQLSNGNIAMAIACFGTTAALYHAINSATGATVLAATLLDTAAANTTYQGFPDIAMVNGYYCCATTEGSGGNAVAYVMNNAGAIQGARYADGCTANGSSGNHAKLVTDGSGFIFIYQSASGYFKICYLPVTGTGYLATNTRENTGGLIEAAYDRGMTYIFMGSSLYVYQVTPGAPAVMLSSIAGVVAGSVMRAMGDYCILTASYTGTSTNFGIIKSLSSSIVGVAQNTVAAGNAGTLVNYAIGPGGYSCNPIVGTVGKGFDHAGYISLSNAGLLANKGVMLSDSVFLKGM